MVSELTETRTALISYSARNRHHRPSAGWEILGMTSRRHEDQGDIKWGVEALRNGTSLISGCLEPEVVRLQPHPAA